MAEIKLNKSQREAVEDIDGPMLVLAGPGTGKTQLLSARVARILEQTDTLASNILCLTFTEAGAANMLERLTSFIGQAAYEVNISTYHSFGGDLIRRYPQYFTETRLENPADELAQHEILASIIDKLSYQNPLKTIRVADLAGTISEVKRGLLTASELAEIASENLEFLSAASAEISEIFSDFARMPNLTKSLPYFENTLAALEKFSTSSLAKTASTSLTLALEEAETTKPLTAWKNDWLVKNSSNEFVLVGELASRKLAALADVLADYEKALAARGLYDYDDMILRAVTALETNDDLRFTLQENYQYILLDEYQDTNAAQAKLVELLTNNPASYGQPNVMAVGDDDQAIYAFQGAEASNLKDFADRYQGIKIIPLTENYRSQPDILLAAANVASQIKDRASTNFNIDKSLVASGEISPPTIIRQQFLSELAERDWVASKIENLITKKDVKPSQIAVLAPRHKLLEPLVPFLNRLAIPVHYEKRENILEAPIIHELVTMSRLVLALADHNESLANALWPEILSYEFFEINVEEIWQINWATEASWTKKLLTSKHKWLALFFLQLAALAKTETLETMLDYLVGSEQLKLADSKIKTATSPLKKYFTSEQMEAERPEIFYQTISHLTVLRQNLRARQASEDEALALADLLALVDLYEASGTRMINTSPYNQASESVQLMTVFKAKGLEFEHVFLLGCIDEIWGSKASGGSNQLALPANLASIRRAGASDDERLRILFVALTRAKLGLYLTSASSNYAGKATTRLKYFDERETEKDKFEALILPEKYQKVVSSQSEIPDISALETNWQNRHVSALASTKLADLLAERVKNYQLSPTHLNTFIDLERGGPRAFLLNTLLKFPQAPSPAGSYGNAIHETLEWLQLEINNNKRPTSAQILNYFEKDMISKKLASDETVRRIEQGRFELEKYLASTNFKKDDEAEVKFKNEGVFVGRAHLNGKIDKLEIDKANKSLIIVDYKTGSPAGKWGYDLKFHKFKQQLYIYKMLVENSASWRGWTVASERLDFIKPDTSGANLSLELKFARDEFEQTQALVEAMWRHVQALHFPDVSGYSRDFAGTKQFEADLVAGKI